MTLDTSPRTYRFIPADVFLANQRVAGKITVTSNGAIASLNDPTHSVLEVHDAHLAHPHAPTKVMDHFELTRLVKAQIYAVCLPRPEDLGPQAIVRQGHANVSEYPVHIALPMFEVEGIMELPGRFDFGALTIEGAREFIPILKATLTGFLFTNLRVESGGILVNRRWIDLIALLTQRVPQQS